MADIPKLTDLIFDKVWTSATDFPTVETDEAQVRADLQYMPDLIRDFINGKLIPPTNQLIEALNNAVGTGDMQRSVYDPQRRDTDVFGYIDDAVDDVTKDIGAALKAAKGYTNEETAKLDTELREYVVEYVDEHGGGKYVPASVEDTTLIMPYMREGGVES